MTQCQILGGGATSEVPTMQLDPRNLRTHWPTRGPQRVPVQGRLATAGQVCPAAPPDPGPAPRYCRLQSGPDAASPAPAAVALFLPSGRWQAGPSSHNVVLDALSTLLSPQTPSSQTHNLPGFNSHVEGVVVVVWETTNFVFFWKNTF